MVEKVIFSTEPEDFHYMNINVPCQGACPAYTNIPGYIRSLYEGRYDRSYEINRMANILPGVLGRVCSRPCEDKCRHGEPELGRPVNICHIKRAAADLSKPVALPSGFPSPPIEKRVAVIGSGPAGLAAAHDLAILGVSVTLFEALEKPGGMLRYGIPEFRLPRHILDEEIAAILGLGVVLEKGVRIGRDIATETLLTEYDAVLITTGCYESNRLNIPGEKSPGLFTGLEYMMDVCAGNPPAVGKRVLVIGAGFTAFDCVRSALRFGAEDVMICLRRTEEDLRVTRDEISETKIEGVKINSLMLSRRIMGKDRVEGVEFVRTHPANRKGNGKSEIRPIKGSEFILPADTVIVATGQGPQTFQAPGIKNDRGILIADRETFRTSEKRLYVAGDYLTGPSTVIEAIAGGRRAAEKIIEDFTGKVHRQKIVRLEEAEITDRERSWDFTSRQEMPTITPVKERFGGIGKEVEKGFSEANAKEESKRCYLCYLHYEIDLDRCIYCRYCIDVAPRDCIKLVDEIKVNDVGAIEGFVETTSWQDVHAVVIDNARCIRCGECMRVCPVDCISVTRVELVENNLQAGENHG
ncbi:FAD-dependent oxidoreductase [Thermodesulfobacteriota bacterium]